MVAMTIKAQSDSLTKHYPTELTKITPTLTGFVTKEVQMLKAGELKSLCLNLRTKILIVTWLESWYEVGMGW